jgi:hypothetical protein
MDPSVVPVFSLAWAAFWIALAAVIISGRWLAARRDALKYDTIVRLAEKTGRVDDEQIKLLFPCPPPGHPLPPHWFAPPPPGNGRMALRVFGTLALAVALGLFTVFWVPGLRNPAIPGLGFAVVLAFFGAGLFIASRFAPGRKDDREAP